MTRNGVVPVKAIMDKAYAVFTANLGIKGKRDLSIAENMVLILLKERTPDELLVTIADRVFSLEIRGLLLFVLMSPNINWVPFLNRKNISVGREVIEDLIWTSIDPRLYKPACLAFKYMMGVLKEYSPGNLVDAGISLGWFMVQSELAHRLLNHVIRSNRSILVHSLPVLAFSGPRLTTTSLARIFCGELVPMKTLLRKQQSLHVMIREMMRRDEGSKYLTVIQEYTNFVLAYLLLDDTTRCRPLIFEKALMFLLTLTDIQGIVTKALGTLDEDMTRRLLDCLPQDSDGLLMLRSEMDRLNLTGSFQLFWKQYASREMSGLALAH